MYCIKLEKQKFTVVTNGRMHPIFSRFRQVLAAFSPRPGHHSCSCLSFAKGKLLLTETVTGGNVGNVPVGRHQY